MCSDVLSHEVLTFSGASQLLKPGTQGGEEVMGRAAQLSSGMVALEEFI